MGAAALPHARAALAALAAIRESLDALAGLARGHLTVGTVASISSPAIDVPSLLARYHRDHPGIEITLVEAGTDGLVGALHAGRVDVALIGLGPTPPAGLVTDVLVDEPLVAVTSPGHPLAARASVSLAELAGYPVISLPPGTGLRACLDHAWARLGAAPRVALEAGDPRTVVRLAASGLGVAIVPAPAAEGGWAPLHVARIIDPPLAGRIGLSARAGEPSPAARAFIEHVRAHRAA